MSQTNPADEEDVEICVAEDETIAIVEKIAQTFKEHDRNGDGVLSTDELRKLLSLLDPPPDKSKPSEKELDLILQSFMCEVDTNKNGVVEMREFVTWVWKAEKSRPSLQPAAFPPRVKGPPDEERKRDLADVFRRLLDKIDRSPAVCLPIRKGRDWQLISRSPFSEAAAVTDGWERVQAASEQDSGCDAAAGCFIGLALGDAVGHPLEFIDVDASLADETGGYSDDARPCLLPTLGDGGLTYRNPVNKFKLKPGQWTDDSSMSLCLADSLLAHGRYHGGDARVRWHMWWYHGYCNAFREDTERKNRSSVGLGGNVAKSLDEIKLLVGTDDAAEKAPAIYDSKHNDAGNGSIMRLAAVPIAFHHSAEQASRVAALQSLATHPGGEAAACCCFMAFFIVQAIQARRGGRSFSRDLRSFITEVIDKFVAASCAHRTMLEGILEAADAAAAMERLRALLQREPPSPKEQNWDWQQEKLLIHEALRERWTGPDGIFDPHSKYNGHPVSSLYFGSYCMDGLAMALWALWHSSSFSSCLLRAVNLLGDADTVGAVAGQLAGAVYGLKEFVADGWVSSCLSDMRRWDPHGELALRAALLYYLEPDEARDKKIM